MSQTIARMESDDLLASADEVIAAAQQKLTDLCHGERWRMSVPVQDSDSDVALGAVIRLAARLRDERTADQLRMDWLEGVLVGPIPEPPISYDDDTRLWTHEDGRTFKKFREALDCARASESRREP